ncbi:CaiB/BaiF CoA transferase family protein [Sulfitobacter sp. 1A12057]|uniref:CaiB/BaiF CoA transferase family protein n=1 Tax=Sulfitobacter sp. 1A12057 TaxID=3368567 RepID=UPI003744F07F
MSQTKVDDHSAPEKPSPSLPLDGVKVLDLSRVLAGPWATMSLADLGAEVWKIENIQGGDDTRSWSTPSYKGVSTYYLCANRGKQSLAVDLKTEPGRSIVLELAAQADIVVENFRAGTMDRLGIGYETLKQANPALIYCAISGYGQTGPEADRPGYDFVMQAESGLMAITGDAEGVPTRFGVAITDLVAGMTATQSILAALFQARATGQGQFIDVALLDCAMNTLVNVATGYLNTGDAPRRYGNGHATVVPYQTFEASDGTFALAVGNDRQFAALCRRVLHLPDLVTDTRFATAKSRAVHRDALLQHLEPAFRARTCEHWLSRCRAESVPAGAVLDVPAALDSDPVRHRDLVETLDHPHLGPIRMLRAAHGLAAQADRPHRAPPMLGEDSAGILRDVLGYGSARIRELAESGVIAEFDPGKEQS